MPEQQVAQWPEDLFPRTEAMKLSGLEYMQAMLEGRIPHPPISAWSGGRVHSVEPGRVVFRAVTDFRHCNPMGAVHGGWYGTMLDSALGCAVMTCVARGSGYTTLEYKVNITRAAPLGTEVEVTGLISHSGRSTAVATAELRGLADGRLYATGSTTCIILSGAPPAASGN